MRKTLCSVVIACLALPATASAGGNARIDPNSPSGVEYAIPFERAREEAVGAAGRKGGGESGGPSGSQLFGAGISKRGKGAKGAPPNSRASNGRSRNEEVVAPGEAAGSPRIDLDEGGGSSALVWMLLILTAVVASGAILALLMRSSWKGHTAKLRGKLLARLARRSTALQRAFKLDIK